MPLAPEQQSQPEASALVLSAGIPSGAIVRSPADLAIIVSEFAATSEAWMDRVRLRTGHRWYERLHHGPDHDIWAISWLPGQSTGFHDHAESAGAFIVTAGVLEEHRPGEQPLTILPDQPRAFGPDYAHDVRNVSLAPAISIHAYSPPLTDMNEYDLHGDQLIPRERASDRVETLHQQRRAGSDQAAIRPTAPGIEQILASARARLHRLSPHQAFHATAISDAVLVDIRPEAQRATEGEVPGALVVERNVLEWRFDPASSARLPVATSLDLQVIVFCSEGYTSSLAAAALQDLGLWRATDLIGGFKAWHTAGLPSVPQTRSA